MLTRSKTRSRPPSRSTSEKAERSEKLLTDLGESMGIDPRDLTFHLEGRSHSFSAALEREQAGEPRYPEDGLEELLHHNEGSPISLYSDAEGYAVDETRGSEQYREEIQRLGAVESLVDTPLKFQGWRTNPREDLKERLEYFWTKKALGLTSKPPYHSPEISQSKDNNSPDKEENLFENWLKKETMEQKACQEAREKAQQNQIIKDLCKKAAHQDQQIEDLKKLITQVWKDKADKKVKSEKGDDEE